MNELNPIDDPGRIPFCSGAMPGGPNEVEPIDDAGDSLPPANADRANADAKSPLLIPCPFDDPRRAKPNLELRLDISSADGGGEDEPECASLRLSKLVVSANGSKEPRYPG